LPQPKHLDPSAFDVPGGTVGALLIHGYTGSVAETRPMGEYLAARGFTVHCPLLPGHGTDPEDLTRICWQAWAEEVESAWQDLRARCETVFVGGLSLGGLLTLWLGVEHPEIAGLIPMAPALKARNRFFPLTPLLRHFLKYDPFGGKGGEDLGDPHAFERVWSYDEKPLWGAAEVYALQRKVRNSLPEVRQPLLIFQGCRDAWVPPSAAEMVYEGVASTDKTLVWLEHSGHNLLVDGEREAVWAQSYAWMMDRASPDQN
jgi:carboxylesterase